MKGKLSLKLVVVLLLLFTIQPLVFAQVSLTEISLKQQINNSSLVIEGKVISKKSFWDTDHRVIYTAHTVEVYKVFKGEALQTIEIITEGGVVGFDALIVSHTLTLKEGSIGVFTLYDSKVKLSSENTSKNKTFKTYAASQGFYKYDLYTNVAKNTFHKKRDIKTSLYNDIMSITKSNYQEIASFDIENAHKKLTQKTSSRPPSNITFSPTTITAGTKSVLTINGSGFGTVKGKVGFINSDNPDDPTPDPDPNDNFVDALDSQVLTWTDSQITVQVPSLADTGTAGTGIIRITDDLGARAFSAASLTISYAETNIPFDLTDGAGLKAYPTQHYDDNGSGAYTWAMQTDFFNDTEHPGAKEAFMRAFDKWRCTTKVNWDISGTATTTDVVGVNIDADPELEPDGENVIRFDNGSELEAGILGTCRSWYAARLCSGVLIWYVADLDIVFDSQTNWYFGTGNFDLGKFDFETVALHELGHGHQLGHVVNTNNVMHYSLDSNESFLTLDASSITAAGNVQTRSTTNQICGIPAKPLMTNYAGSCGLNIEENEIENELVIYPNPSKHEFFIKNAAFYNLEKVQIYDVNGRLISEHNISNPSGTVRIGLEGISKGLYILNIKSDIASTTKKLVVQ